MYAKLDELADNGAERAHQPREIDLAEDAGIGHEGVAGAGEAGRKIVPDDDATHLEEQGIHPIGGYFGDHVKQQQAHHGGEYGLDEMPERTEDGLLVLGGKIPFYKQPEQVAVLPEVAEVLLVPAAGFYYYWWLQGGG